MNFFTVLFELFTGKNVPDYTWPCMTVIMVLLVAAAVVVTLHFTQQPTGDSGDIFLDPFDDDFFDNNPFS